MAGITDINWLYNKYYGDNPELRRIVTIHSELVAKKALEICQLKNLPLKPIDVYCGAMLHDIGVVKCHAPDIYAFGTSPYICHGLEGKKILDSHGLNRFSPICLNHTGSGIDKKEIIEKNLPLPHHDMVPVTLLEKLICYADKFYSKSKDLYHEKNVDEIMAQMQRFGNNSYKRFLDLHYLFCQTS